MSSFGKSTKHSNIIAGLDFGTTKICAVIGIPKDEGIEIIGVGKQPSLGIRKGVVVNIPTTVDAIKKAVEAAELMAGVNISSAYTGIVGGHIKGFNSTGVVAIKQKEVTRQDVERAIDAAKAVSITPDREVLHVIPQEFVVNGQDGVRDPVGMAGVRLESRIHIVTGDVSSAQNIIKCVNVAGVDVADIVLEPLASAEAVLTEDEKELGVALVDIGGGTTDVAIFVRGSVVHTAVIPMGGNHITNDIAVGLRTSIQEAESIKISSGCAMSSMISSDETVEIPASSGKKAREISRSILTKIIEPRIEEILNLVNQELVTSGHKHLLSTGVVITGGASMLAGLAEFSEFIMEVPVRLGAPMGFGGILDIVSSPAYSTAAGLLVYGMKDKSGFMLSAKDAGLYSKVTSKMKSWLGDVF